MDTRDSIQLLILLGLAYLIYRVHRLEQVVTGRKPGRRGGSGKVIPILKENIEPGPFKPGPKKTD